jgi:osmotically inducible protein OsmC
MSTTPTPTHVPEKILYTAEATSTGEGRNGHVRTSDDRLDLELAMPSALGGTGEGTNPEQLFASGYAACFHSALKFAALKQHIKLPGSAVTALVSLGPEGDAFALAVKLVVELPGFEREQALALAQAAHQVCPYSRATHGNIGVELEVL